jgi:formate hydrogenlyase subunit 6/NADH:ubiquinone oxidoreductase subunit I
MFEMLGNILKNMVSKPATRMYPVEKRAPFKDTRGHIDMDIDSCIFCGICSKKCPSNAINVSRNDKSWEIDPFKCIICNVCTEVCPKKCICNIEEYKPSSYAKGNTRYVQKPKPVQEKPAQETVKASEAQKKPAQE